MCNCKVGLDDAILMPMPEYFVIDYEQVDLLIHIRSE